ncbi:hypothetical protein DMC30DRAFT_445434 [Rhodotorula diobovata]|uniref:DUF6534 domain-containing protein n=1 Tax=Rhodotorula diobovata TaxID=5288 RepID=A0A5C5G2W1_9BASI|nr:hypothetical protein DMC30DRAFT_445434 [Rhodotorula diobovata]
MSAGPMSPEDQAAAAAQLARFQFAIANVVTPVLVATFLACTLYGVLLIMAISYFSRFGRTDRLTFRLVIAVLVLTTLADTVNQCVWAFLYCVTAQTDPVVLAAFPDTLPIFAVLTGINVLFAQAFFTWRLWIISDRENWVLPSGLLLLELTAAALSFTLAYRVSQGTVVEWGNAKWLLYTWMASGAFCDLIITGAIAYYLIVRPQRVSGTATNAKLSRSNPLGRIVLKTVQTNGLSLVVQFTTLVITVTNGGQLWYAVTGFALSKVYVLSVVATLNARRTLLPGDGSSSHTHTGPHSRLSFKRGGASRTGQADQQSSVTPVLVHVTQQVEVHDEVEEKERDQRTLGELPPLGVQVGGAVPYAVRFERARENEGGEVELGRKGESM